MKIAVATDDFLTVTGHIGRCSGFIIYEIQNNAIVSREQKENVFTNHRKDGQQHGQHEHGHSQSHSSLIEGLQGCSNLICSSAGWRVVDDFKNNGIEVVFTNESDADSAALMLANGTLEINADGTCNAH